MTNGRPYARADVAKLSLITTPADTCELLCLDIPKAEQLRKHLPQVADFEAHARAAKALADPTRLAVAWALSKGGRACVCDLAWVVGRDEKLTSHHARQLRTAGLARSEREGKMVMYELTALGRRLLDTVLDGLTV